MANNFDVGSDNSFKAFNKLRNHANSSFFRVTLQFNDVTAACKSIYENMQSLDHSLLELSIQANYLLFVKEFACFRVFFLKYFLYFKLQVNNRLKSKKKKCCASFETIVPSFEDLEPLLKLFQSMNNISNSKLSSMLQNPNGENVILSKSNSGADLDSESNNMTNAAFYLNAGIESLQTTFDLARGAIENNNQKQISYLGKIAFMSHNHDYVASIKNEKARDFFFTAAFINKAMVIVNKETDQRTEEDDHFLKQNYNFIYFLYSGDYAKSLLSQLDAFKKSEFWKYLLEYNIDAQRMLSCECICLVKANPNKK